MKFRFQLAISIFALTSAAFVASAQNQGQGAPEIISHRTNPHEAGSVTAGSTGVITPSITYHNGPLIMAPVIYYIFYGNWTQSNGSDNSSGQQILRDFANSIGGSNYFKINTSYSTGGYVISGSVTFGGEYQDSYSQGSRLRDSSILSIVNNAISRGLPYNPDGVYFVLTSSDVTETSGFCTKYCGWHTAGNANTGHVRYAFVGNANRCLNACAAQTISPNGNAGVDAMISVIAHELEEATTDADPRSGWADSNGSENADKCAWTFGQNQKTLSSGAVYNVSLPTVSQTRNYLIQRNLASDNKCYMDNTVSPPLQ